MFLPNPYYLVDFIKKFKCITISKVFHTRHLVPKPYPSVFLQTNQNKRYFEENGSTHSLALVSIQ